MVDPEAKLQRLITPEIAELYGRSTHTVTKAWAAHPEWPAPVGKRGRYNEYDAEQVAAFVRAHAARHADDLEPDRLYTAQQIGDAAGISAGTIRADVSKGRWPAPDDTAHGVKRWYGRTAKETLATRRRRTHRPRA
jgi:hypothetical protein